MTDDGANIADLYFQAATRVLRALVAISHHDHRWAKNACARTRRYHRAVWTRKPSRNVVQTQLIEAFRLVASAVKEVPRSDEHPTDEYAANVEARIANLDRYVQDLSSAFDPDAIDPAEKAVTA